MLSSWFSANWNLSVCNASTTGWFQLQLCMAGTTTTISITWHQGTLKGRQMAALKGRQMAALLRCCVMNDLVPHNGPGEALHSGGCLTQWPLSTGPVYILQWGRRGSFQCCWCNGRIMSIHSHCRIYDNLISGHLSQIGLRQLRSRSIRPFGPNVQCACHLCR